jgi:hypothetical protein
MNHLHVFFAGIDRYRDDSERLVHPEIDPRRP